MSGRYFYKIDNNFLPLSGGTVTGDSYFNASLSANTFYSGSTDLYDIFLTTGNSGDITRLQDGINTFTGGTPNEPTVNITGLTLDNIYVSGNSSFNSISATTIYSGSTNLYDIFSTNSGTSGTSGIDGTSGTSGTAGTSGTSGIDGTSGTSGTSGIDGTSGTSGTAGTSGTSGVDGTSGTSGVDGTSGTSGTAGTSGTSGVDGTSGTSGVDGTSGTSGIDGTSGTSGVSGTSGTSGIDGTSGTSGVSGTSGTSGIDGTSGTSGTAGTSGTSGVDGTSGTSGTAGTSGTSGVDGTSGTSGVDGTSGTAGTSGVEGLTKVQPGTNITTGGTENQPIINVVDSPSFNQLTTSGNTLVNSSFTVTGNTILSGTTTVGNDIEPNVDNSIDLGAPSFRWREIYTTNLDATNAITVNSLYAGFQIESPSISGTSISASTIYSGSTDLYDIFLTTADGNDITRVQPGTNITTGGTANEPIVNLADNVVIGSLSATSVSAATIYSGSTNLGVFINDIYSNLYNKYDKTGGTVFGDVVIQGNVDVLGTATTFYTETVQSKDNNIELNFSGNHLTAIGGGITVVSGQTSGESTKWYTDSNGNWNSNVDVYATQFSANTISGSNIFSAGTNLNSIFVNDVNAGNNIEVTAGKSPVVSLKDDIVLNSINTNSISGGTIYSGSTDLSTLFSTSPNTYLTGSTITGNTTLVLSRNDGGVITTELEITRSLSLNAESFVLDSATRVTLTPLAISAIRFAGVGLPDVAGLSFVVPYDYKNNGQFSFVWRDSSANNTLSAKTIWNVYTGDTNNLGSLVTSVGSFNIIDTPESTANVFIFSPYANLTGVTIQPGMKIHCTITRNPADSEDTLNSDLDMIDFIFRYNALR